LVRSLIRAASSSAQPDDARHRLAVAAPGLVEQRPRDADQRRLAGIGYMRSRIGRHDRQRLAERIAGHPQQPGIGPRWPSAWTIQSRWHRVAEAWPIWLVRTRILGKKGGA